MADPRAAQARELVRIRITEDGYGVDIGQRTYHFQSEESAVVEREWWIEFLATALAAAQGQARLEARDKAIELFGGIAASHRWFNLSGFIEWCERGPMSVARNHRVPEFDSSTQGQWTDQRPTVPGWYWWRIAPGHYSIIERYDKSADGLVMYGKDMHKHQLVNGEWCGPIEPPREAES